MKLGPTKSKAGKLISPFELAMQRQGEQNKNTPTGPGIGLNRAVPGLGKPVSAKRKRPFAQILGDTPERDGPFAASAQPVYDQFPPKSVNRKRRTKYASKKGKTGSGGANPFGQ